MSRCRLSCIGDASWHRSYHSTAGLIFTSTAVKPEDRRRHLPAELLRHLNVGRARINTNDLTFNQELGINIYGVIAGYFGRGASGHPNNGYTVVPPYTAQKNFINENFPGSVQTQVTGINNKLKPTTVGLWADSNNANMVNNNFGFVNFGGQNGTFVEVNHPGTGTINGVMTN